MFLDHLMNLHLKSSSVIEIQGLDGFHSQKYENVFESPTSELFILHYNRKNNKNNLWLV